MFIPKTQRWEFKDGEEIYRISLSSPTFIRGTMKFRINDKEYLLKPLKAFSIGFKREEAFALGGNRGILRIAFNGDAHIFIDGEEIEKIYKK